MTVPKIELKTEKASLIAREKQTIDLLVRITPPVPNDEDAVRPKLNIGIALDRSGSMEGEKMQQAREAAKFCVDQLLDNDRFSAVIFDDQVDVLFTNQNLTDRAMIKRGIDRIEARNSTALHQGWVSAGLQVSEALDPLAINRVLLITDGQANVGETRIDELVRQAREASARGVSTSTIGIGRDFNEDLLMQMAEGAQGNAWHVREAADMVSIFGAELKGLVRQIGHTVRLSVRTADGVRVIEMLNDFDRTGEHWILPNLLGGSRLDMIVRLEISDPAKVSGEMATFELKYTDQRTGQSRDVRAQFSTSFISRAESERLASNKEVIQTVRLLMNARARREAMERMDAGDFDRSVSILKSVVLRTRAAAANAPSAEFFAELQDLDDLSKRIEQNQDPIMARKMAAYQRESRRKGR